MKITLADINENVCDAWGRMFRGTDVHIHLGSIFDVHADAVVSPGNSFGIMNGGFDFLLRNAYGVILQDAIQMAIVQWWKESELPVGEALFVYVNPMLYPKRFHNGVIYAPTMRLPSNVSTTNNAYKAFGAALREAKRQGFIDSLVCPGLCTWSGGMDYDESARQMREAYNEYLKG